MQWVQRWNDTIAAEPELPGVWRRKDGGFRIRGRTRDPKTNHRVEVNRALPDCKRAREAAAVLESELAARRAGGAVELAMPRFMHWCATVFERKVASGEIASAGGRAKWESVLANHLLPAFGQYFVDKLTREDVERWKVDVLLAERTHTKDGKRTRELAGGKYRPQTVNTILGVLRQITAAASDSFNIPDPCRRVENVPKRGHRTYTHESPNALKPEDVPRFLEEVRVRYPEHYAFVYLGFTTGLRPSSLRPLRARGPNADVKWDSGELLVRRSHTIGDEVMDETKTGRDQTIALTAQQLSTLRWHVDRLQHENERRARRSPHLGAAMASSELLFPAMPSKWNHGGGFRSPSCLDKVFSAVGERLGLGYEITPRCMRRTFQDLARPVMPDIVTRSISGHATPEMQRLYSTVSRDEQRAAIEKLENVIAVDFASRKRAA